MQSKLSTLPRGEFPNFSYVVAGEINNTITDILERHSVILEGLLYSEKEPTWDNFIAPLDEFEDYFEQIWSAISHMHAVCCEDDLRSAYDEVLVKISEYFTKISQNKDLYLKVKDLADSESFSNYSDAQQKIISNQLRDFKLAGVHLDTDKKQQLIELKQLLSQLTTKFEQNIMDATDSFTHVINHEEDLAGIPKMFTDAASNKASQNGLTNSWQFGLDAPTFIAIMSYAEDRSFRELMYRAYISRASDVGPGSNNFDNSQILVDILKLKQQLAVILGFANFAEYSL